MNLLRTVLVGWLALVGCAAPVAASAQQGGTEDTPGVLFASGFEAFPAGGLIEWAGDGVALRAPEGHVSIHTQHRKSGRQSLRIHGGEDRGFEIAFEQGDFPEAVVSFWAERWTARSPFRFRVLGWVDGTWQEVYRGDEAIAVGGFDTQVRFALPAGTERLRFLSSTPPDSGIMIDDLRIGEAVPMRIASVDTHQPVSPALIGNRTNPVALVEVKVVGSTEPITLEQMRISMTGTTDLREVEAVEVYYTGGDRDLSNNVPDDNFPEASRFGRRQRPGHELTFRGGQVLQEGANYFWVSYQLKDDANIDHRLDAGCLWVRTDRSREALVPTTTHPDGAQRLGVALRTAHDDGVRSYRIPGLATTNHGTLIAVYDIRHSSWGDLPGDIDVGMSRSTDGGRTWEPMKAIMDMGNEDGAGLRGNGIGDPAVLVDTATNTIWVAALWSHGNRGWNGSGPGMSPEETGQLILVKSEDDGVTWSEPINITEQVKQPSWHLMFNGPGKGITLSDGTLVFPAQYRDTAENGRIPKSTLIYSEDHGETWAVGTGAYLDTTEAQVVELEDGVLMLNCRYNRQNRRVVMTTRDLGMTWAEHPTTRDALTEPGSCMASLINVDRELGRPYRGVLLFSNPASTQARREMTIRASVDGGMTWPEGMSLLIDHGISAGYSCMTMIDDDTVGILYEGNRAHMTFQRIPLADLVGEKPE